MRSKELVLYIGALTGPLAGNAVLALLDTFGTLWNISATTVLLTIPVFMFPFAAMQIFSGTISDAYDRRKTVMLGFAIYAAGGFAAAASPSFGFFMATRFIQGIGFALVQPVLVALLSDIAGPGRQGLVMGYYGSYTTAGIAIGPLAAGLFAEVDWRLTFVFIGVLATAVLVGVASILGEETRPRTPLSVGVIGHQLRITARNRDVILLAICGFLSFVSFIGLVSFAAEQMGRMPLDLSPTRIGLAIAFSGILGVVTSPYSGRLVDRRGARLGALFGFGVSTIAAALLVSATTYLHFVVLMGLIGFGTSFVWAALLTMSVRAYPSLKGTASSVFNSSRFFGYAFSPILLTPVYFLGGFSLVMATCAILSALAMGVVVLTGRNLDRE